MLVPLHQAQKEAAQRAAEERERQRIAAEQQAEQERQREAQPVQATAPIVQGGCMDWMNQAGITDVTNAYQLIMAESGCNPGSVNQKSGACGIGQQLPCGKWPHAWNDPVGGMLDMQGYVMSRYGSWAAAWSFHVANGYY